MPERNIFIRLWRKLFPIRFVECSVNEVAEMKKDFLGSELNIGDEVVFMQIHYRGLMKGKIKSLSNKKAVIEHEMTNLCSTESSQFHDQLIKIVTS